MTRKIEHSGGAAPFMSLVLFVKGMKGSTTRQQVEGAPDGIVVVPTSAERCHSSKKQMVGVWWKPRL
jgi:hypothetical protein